MMLGDILAAARRSGDGLDRWLAPASPDLWRLASAKAAHDGMTEADFARLCVAEFTSGASEEAWATLVSRLRDTEDPGRECLMEMMRWRLSGDGATRGPQAEDTA